MVLRTHVGSVLTLQAVIARRRWTGFNCDTASTYGYSAGEVASLKDACPAACGECTPNVDTKASTNATSTKVAQKVAGANVATRDPKEATIDERLTKLEQRLGDVLHRDPHTT